MEMSIRKDMPGFVIIEKCMTACRTGDFQSVTRADVDAAMDSVAKAIAQEHEISFSDAYSAMLESQQGRELYAAHATLPATGPGLVVKREDDAIAKAETTERDTERYAAATGLDLATARRHVADYYRQ